MQSIPVDGTRLGTMTCIVPPEVKVTDRETGAVKRDKDGQTVFTVGVAVRQEDRRVSVVEISVSGEPVGVTEGVRVHVTGLTAFSWAMGDRHGLAFRADSITPAPAPATPAAPAAAPAPAAAAGRKGGDA